MNELDDSQFRKQEVRGSNPRWGSVVRSEDAGAVDQARPLQVASGPHCVPENEAAKLPARSAPGDLPARFAAKISPEPNTGCWLWMGAVDRNGYAQVNHAGRSAYAHITVREILVGAHAAEDLDHTCRIRSCVNPAHLEPVSHRENVRRGGGFAGLNARKTHCKRGHEFTPENIRPHGNGNRSCRQCEGVRRLAARLRQLLITVRR